MEELKLGIYRHYKDGRYEVIGVGKYTEKDKHLVEVVIYKQLYDAPEYPKGYIWVRSKKEFLETVVGKEVPRFKYVGNNYESGTGCS